MCFCCLNDTVYFYVVVRSPRCGDLVSIWGLICSYTGFYVLGVSTERTHIWCVSVPLVMINTVRTGYLSMYYILLKCFQMLY